MDRHTQSPVPLDRALTSDPITDRPIEVTESTLWLQEGDPDDGITLYFESRETLEAYRGIPVERPETGLSHTLSNSLDEGFDEG